MKGLLVGKSWDKRAATVLILVLGAFVWLWAPQPVSADARSLLEKYWLESYGNISLQAADTAVKAENVQTINGYTRELLAKAQPDECFQGLGNPANLNAPNTGLGFFDNYPGDLSEEQKAACREITSEYSTPSGQAQPKTNQAYVWGLTKAGDNLWFGTVPNTHCLVLSSYLGISIPFMNGSWVCEGEASTVGDFRPPRAFYYNLSTKELVEVTQKILEKSDVDRSRLMNTIGLRSAGASLFSRYGKGQVVFFGGVSQSGVNLFAFDANSGNYLGSMSFDGQEGRPLYTNIRQWRLVGRYLYVGVAKPGGGEVLRWQGRLSSDPNLLFKFEKVGEIGGDPAYMTYHAGRLFVSTWPDFSGSQEMSIWMSPMFSMYGMLRSGNADKWKSVWKISDYEPELSVVMSTAGGALISYGGYLYWGTMHVPALSLIAWQQIYGQTATQDDIDGALLGTYRPISLFRGKSFGTRSQRVELLYGNPSLPRYAPGEGWAIVPNKMGQTPAYGFAGINNFFNNYTWWMEVYRNKLFVGTMDFLYLIRAGLDLGNGFEFPKEFLEMTNHFEGADLWSFNSAKSAATPVSLDGVGNYTNYGIRTMVSAKEGLYLGSANPMNLLTDPESPVPLGGWELMKLTPNQ